MGKCIVSIFAPTSRSQSELEGWWRKFESLELCWVNKTYHVLMFCLADGDIVREISVVADRLVGSMLLIRVSSTEARRIATAWEVPTDSALKL